MKAGNSDYTSYKKDLMITHTVELTVPTAKSEDFYDFMTRPDSNSYYE